MWCVGCFKVSASIYVANVWAIRRMHETKRDIYIWKETYIYEKRHIYGCFEVSASASLATTHERPLKLMVVCWAIDVVCWVSTKSHCNCPPCYDTRKAPEINVVCWAIYVVCWVLTRGHFTAPLAMTHEFPTKLYLLNPESCTQTHTCIFPLRTVLYTHTDTHVHTHTQAHVHARIHARTHAHKHLQIFLQNGNLLGERFFLEQNRGAFIAQLL